MEYPVALLIDAETEHRQVRMKTAERFELFAAGQVRQIAIDQNQVWYGDAKGSQGVLQAGEVICATKTWLTIDPINQRPANLFFRFENRHDAQRLRGRAV